MNKKIQRIIFEGEPNRTFRCKNIIETKFPIDSSINRFDTGWKDTEYKSSPEEISQDAAQRDNEMKTGRVNKEVRRTGGDCLTIRVLKGEESDSGERRIKRWREQMKKTSNQWSSANPKQNKQKEIPPSYQSETTVHKNREKSLLKKPGRKNRSLFCLFFAL